MLFVVRRYDCRLFNAIGIATIIYTMNMHVISVESMNMHEISVESMHIHVQ